MNLISRLVVRFQHTISVASFVCGFLLDTIFLKRIDVWESQVLLAVYLVVAVASIVVMQRRAHRQSQWLPFVAQFSFGGMFSAFLIFYSQSGSLFASWPFILIILSLIVVNEALRTYQSRLAFQMTLLFFCIFSVSIYAVPIFMHTLGPGIFLLSGLVAWVAYGVLAGMVYVSNRARFREVAQRIAGGAVLTFITLNVLYFTDVLPPIPLALRSAGVYLSVDKQGSNYIGTYHEQPWYADFFRDRIARTENETVSVFSAVFAPSDLVAEVRHVWEYYDVDKKTWVTRGVVPFSIVGGRDGGYRLFSTLRVARTGEWRVNVQTVQGQLIGRTTFDVVRPTGSEGPIMSAQIE